MDIEKNREMTWVTEFSAWLSLTPSTKCCKKMRIGYKLLGWARSELCICARLRVDLLSTLALPLQEVSTHQKSFLIFIACGSWGFSSGGENVSAK